MAQTKATTQPIKDHPRNRFKVNIAPVFALFLLFDVFTNPLNEFDSIPTGIESLLILITSLILLYEKILKSNNYFTAFVWIAIGLIFFFAGTFFLFIMSQNNYSNTDFNDTYGYIVAIFKILMYSFFFVGIISEIRLKIAGTCQLFRSISAAKFSGRTLAKFAANPPPVT